MLRTPLTYLVLLIVWIVLSSSASADCLQGNTADREGNLDEAIKLYEAALDNPACAGVQRLLSYNLGLALAERATIADHCRAAELLALLVESKQKPYSLKARPYAVIERLHCEVKRRLKEGDRTGAITLLEGFEGRHAGDEDKRLREASIRANDEARDIRARFGGVIIECPEGDSVAIVGVIDSQPCPMRWGVVPVGSTIVTLSHQGDELLTEQVTVQADFDVQVDLGAVASAVRSSRQGAALLDAGDDDAALAEFDRAAAAFSALPGRAVDAAVQRLNAAKVLERVGRAQEAFKVYEELRLLPLPSELKADVAERSATLKENLFGQVEVTCQIAHARIVLDVLPNEVHGCGVTWEGVPVGRHTLSAEFSDGTQLDREIAVKGGQTTHVVLNLTPNRMLAWTLTGLAVASLATGATFFVLASESSEDFERALSRNLQASDPEPRFEAYEDGRRAKERADTQILVSYVGLGVGAVLGGFSLWAWLDDPSTVHAASTRLTLMGMPSYLSIQGSW